MLNNSVDKDGNTPLHIAVFNREIDQALALINAGAEINGFNDVNATPLMYSASRNCAQIAEALIRAGAGVNLRKEQSNTPLHLAAIHGHDEVAELLIRLGADINAINFKNRTPLYCAAKNAHIKTILLLVQSGANIDSVPLVKFIERLVACVQKTIEDQDREEAYKLLNLLQAKLTENTSKQLTFSTRSALKAIQNGAILSNAEEAKSEEESVSYGYSIYDKHKRRNCTILGTGLVFSDDQKLSKSEKILHKINWLEKYANARSIVFTQFAFSENAKKKMTALLFDFLSRNFSITKIKNYKKIVDESARVEINDLLKRNKNFNDYNRKEKVVLFSIFSSLVLLGCIYPFVKALSFFTVGPLALALCCIGGLAIHHYRDKYIQNAVTQYFDNLPTTATTQEDKEFGRTLSFLLGQESQKAFSPLLWSKETWKYPKEYYAGAFIPKSCVEIERVTMTLISQANTAHSIPVAEKFYSIKAKF